MPERPDGLDMLVLRPSPEVTQTLQAAAREAHRTFSEFVLKSVLARAEETLAGRDHFGLDAER